VCRDASSALDDVSALGKLQVDVGDHLRGLASGLGHWGRGLLDHQLIEQGVNTGEGGWVSSHGGHLGWEEPDV
jgi:hypothetical protein